MSKTIRIPFTTEAYERLVVTEKRGKVVRKNNAPSVPGVTIMGWTETYQEAVLYTDHSLDPLYPLVGSYKNNKGEWQHSWWGPEGIEGDGDTEQALFIEYEARSLGWVNIWKEVGLAGSRELADLGAVKSNFTRVACIEVFEGQGIDDL